MNISEKAAEYAAAWCSGDPMAVALHFAEEGQICINLGDELKGRAAIAEMAAGFHSDFPDLTVECDDVRISGSHAIFVWTLDGHHCETKKHVRTGGWEEWELDENMKIRSSCGWFDVVEYERQIEQGSGLE